MERRFVLFLVLSFAVLFGHMALMSWLSPSRQRPGVEREAGPAGPGEAEEPEDAADRQPPPPERREPPKPRHAADEPPPKPDRIAADQPQEHPRRWVTLGSADPADPYRMLVTLTSRGAAVVRVELNSPRYHDLDNRSGFLGHVSVDETAVDEDLQGKGCVVQVAGPGTPAAKAGLKPGDRILAVGKQKVNNAADLRDALKRTRPNQTVFLTLAGRNRPLPVVLKRQPLEVIRPENDDPLSFLLTLQEVRGKGIEPVELPPPSEADLVRVGREAEPLQLWTSNWELVTAEESQAVFRRRLPQFGLVIEKTYRLAKVPEETTGDPDARAYHLVFELSIRNVSRESRTVAYQLDGPNGLPDEGAWYANKVSRNWGGVGLRDVVVSFNGATPSLVGCPKIADGEVGPAWQDEPLTYIGVDAQYFSSVLIPGKENPGDIWLRQSHPLRIGEVVPERKNQTNTSCRLISKAHELAAGETMGRRFTVFCGPKRPELLARYGLGELVYYGWFGWLAVPMSKILHVFYAVVGNYGLAILMLTVLVRGCMFPLSRKQAMGAQKMQQLQPEIKKIHEKYKNDLEARTKAQQELFRKHNYNPLGGCLVLFVQLPIFIALYRSLMVDIELRQAPLISQSIRWCSNLAAPDMLFDWSGFMPEFITSGRGILGLGPYLNLLPILTVALFIVQQKMFMPPPADDQQAMQQKIMKYMMGFIGLLFFKVASGLCVYFIASSLWGLAERKLLPKPAPLAGGQAAKPPAKSPPKPEPKPQKPALSGRDGAAARRKKKKSKRGRR